MNRKSLTLALLGLLALPTFACGTTVEDETATEEGELRTLSSQEVVGDITYGTELKEIQHPGETSSRRTYVALRFQGVQGDEIEATAIAGNAADPVLYLLGSDFQTLASNDDSAPGDKTPVIKRKLGRSGTYYLAARTKEGWKTKFYVSLKKKGGGTTPPPAPLTWKSGLAGQELWGVQFDNVLPGSAYFGRIPVACRIAVSSATISCAAHGWSFTGGTASIQADGTFALSTGTPGTAGDELKGSIAPDGTVTLNRFRHTTCFQTSSYWCEGRETDGQNLPASVKAFQLCRTPDQTFASGGWASGYYLACSQCNGQCEGGR